MASRFQCILQSVCGIVVETMNATVAYRFLESGAGDFGVPAPL